MKKTTAKPHLIKIKLLKICDREKENLEWKKNPTGRKEQKYEWQ